MSDTDTQETVKAKYARIRERIPDEPGLLDMRQTWDLLDNLRIEDETVIARLRAENERLAKALEQIRDDGRNPPLSVPPKNRAWELANIAQLALAERAQTQPGEGETKGENQ